MKNKQHNKTNKPTLQQANNKQTKKHNRNILIATPGRLLQHLDQTAMMDVGKLQMLGKNKSKQAKKKKFQKQNKSQIIISKTKQNNKMITSSKQRKE
jgi:ATP-dependent RNA helicase DDX10/DBP4